MDDIKKPSHVKTSRDSSHGEIDPELLRQLPRDYTAPFELMIDSEIPLDKTVLVIMPGQYEDWRFTELRDSWKKTS